MPNTSEICAAVRQAIDAKSIESVLQYADELLGRADNAETLTTLGRLTVAAGEPIKGLAYIGEAIRVEPFFGDAQIHRGNMLAQYGAVDEALHAYETLLLFTPFFDEAVFAYCRLAAHHGRHADALEILKRRIRLGKPNPDIYNSLGLAEHANGDLHAALAAYHEAIALAPTVPLYRNNAATIYYHLEQFEDAQTFLESAISLDPNFSIAWHTMGNVHKALRELNLAERAFRKAVTLAPDYGEAHFNLGCVLLQQDRWAEGFREYEWRWRVPGLVEPINANLPMWNGAQLSGRLLVVAEQGHGDTLQFFRYVRSLLDRDIAIAVWAPEGMAQLLRTQAGIEYAAVNRAQLPECVAYIPMMSLPRVLRADIASIPQSPYITSNVGLRSAFERELGPRRERLRVAIAWGGNPAQVENRYRSAALADLAPLFADPTIRWISVQKGPQQSQLRATRFPIEDWSARLTTFEDTAALFDAVDGVVSVCSSPIHLAGALGRPAALMAAWAANWRWRNDTATTPWYQSVSVVRQPALNDWADVATRTLEVVNGWNAQPLSRGTIRAAATGGKRGKVQAKSDGVSLDAATSGISRNVS